MPLGAVTGGLIGLGVLGGIADDRANRRSVEQLERQREEAREYVDRAIQQGRGDLFRISRQAQQQGRQGLEAGIDLINQTLPQQMGLFSQGNQMAQQQLIGALPAMNAAILGQPFNYNPPVMGLQAPPINFRPQPFLQFDDLTYFEPRPETVGT